MDAETRRDIEDLKITLKSLETDEAQLTAELERVRARKRDVKERLAALSNDTQYQADMLAMVYEQRHKNDKNPKDKKKE